MPKQGILHDYDLMANQEESSQGKKCAICGAEDMTFQWSDYSGEAMCTQCGCLYQLKWGTEEMIKEGKYPYLYINDHFLSIAKEYWEDTHRFVCYGMMLGLRPGMGSLIEWLKIHHPEEVKSNGSSE